MTCADMESFVRGSACASDLAFLGSSTSNGVAAVATKSYRLTERRSVCVSTVKIQWTPTAGRGTSLSPIGISMRRTVFDQHRQLPSTTPEVTTETPPTSFPSRPTILQWWNIAIYRNESSFCGHKGSVYSEINGDTQCHTNIVQLRPSVLRRRCYRCS